MGHYLLFCCCTSNEEFKLEKKDADARSFLALLAYKGGRITLQPRELNVEVKVFTNHWMVGVKGDSGT